jgi:catechol 2,3-dioxygenase-like lactoylglutathione lyase family enzyme
LVPGAHTIHMQTTTNQTVERLSAVRFAGDARIHIGLVTGDLARAVAFYTALFGEGPVKTRPRYAKFEPKDPSVNLSLVENPAAARAMRDATADLPSGRHFGVQVQSTTAVLELGERLRAAGLLTRSEKNTSCCYAVQDKVWATDPDGNPWEVFVVLDADAQRLAPQDGTCCVPSGASSASDAAERTTDAAPTRGASCCSAS